MKKAIKNYLAKLHDNKKKGFSLVELIIVIAIMAILVGVVASQVLPYMEKSRKAKDQQQLSGVCTDIVTAVSQQEKEVDNFTWTITSSAVNGVNASNTDKDVLKSFSEIRGDATPSDTNGQNQLKKVVGKLKAKASKNASGVYEMKIVFNNGNVTVTSGAHNDAKLTAESE